MGNTAKTRLYLFTGSALTIAMVASFLVVLNINEPAEYTAIPFNVLLILTILACIGLAFFFAKGPVFNTDRELDSSNINAMLVTVLVIIQISFFFEIISVRNQIMNYRIYTDIRRDISIAENSDSEDLNEALSGLIGHGITEITISDESGRALHSSNEERIGNAVPATTYSYGFEGTNRINFLVDRSYNARQMRSVVLNLLTVLVTSIFFSVEIVLLMIRVISRRMERVLLTEATEAGNNVEKPMLSSLYFIRQISFLFYFGSRLSSAFIPIMAKSLYNPFPWISNTAAAGMPQTAETLLTCSAIFLTTILLEKKGWKMPFISGLFLVVAGTFMSAVSTNLFIFILSRAVVGLGYGFCWMTLRNLSLFARNNAESLLGFALLNAGIYAGINCGSSLGAILADIFGYKTVFIISGVLTLMTSAFIIKMENAVLPRKNSSQGQHIQEDNEMKPMRQHISVALFVILMIAPASIAASYLSYYLPLYFEDIGGSVTDVGRAQLLYGIVIVYGGPMLSKLIASLSHMKALKITNFVYGLMIALSLFLPGVGTGIILPLAGAALLGTADSFGFGVQNNYFLSMPSVINMGASKALSVLSFIKKILEMIGPLVFAVFIALGFQMGIRTMAISFAVMAVLFMILVPNVD